VTGRSQALIGLPVDERSYRVDLELQDRYTAYSAELLRLALLGIAGYGFLLRDVVLAGHAPGVLAQRAHEAWWLLLIGVACLGVSAALALQHRIFATGCVACIVAFLRHQSAGRTGEAERARASLRRNIKGASRTLRLSALALAFGAGAVVVTFGYVLWN
jgi:hypothetical protein